MINPWWRNNYRQRVAGTRAPDELVNAGKESVNPVWGADPPPPPKQYLIRYKPIFSRWGKYEMD